MHCQQEFEDYMYAEIAAADAAVAADDAWAAYQACLTIHGSGSGGGSGSGSGQTAETNFETNRRLASAPAMLIRPEINRTQLQGYIMIRMKSGDSKQKILKKLKKMQK